MATVTLCMEIVEETLLAAVAIMLVTTVVHLKSTTLTTNHLPLTGQLGVPLSTIYGCLLKRGILKPLDHMPIPNPLPPRYDATKYCNFHQTNGHPTDN